MLKKIWAFLLAILLTTPCAHARDKSNVAFVFFSGLYASGIDWGQFQRDIEKAFPDAPIHSVKIFDGSQLSATRGAYKILESANQDIENNRHKLEGKDIVIVGYSQGGLIARAWIQMYGDICNLNLKMFISLGGPHAGQWGLPANYKEYISKIVDQADTVILKSIINFFQFESIDLNSCVPELKNYNLNTIDRNCLNVVKTLLKKAIEVVVKDNWKIIYLLFYNPIFQNKISVAGFWKDPRHLNTYKNRCQFLPYINNEIEHYDSQRYKDNLMGLEKIVMYHANNETIIQPAQSTAFMFYKNKSTNELEQSFEETRQYKDNLLGLQDMYNEGRLEFVECSCKHEYPYDPDVRKHIIASINKVFK